MIDAYQKLELVQELFAKEQYEEGYTCLEQLEEEYATNEDILFEIAVFYYDMGYIEKSLTLFQKAEKLSCDEELIYETRLYQSSVLLELGELEEAFDLLITLKEERAEDEDSRLYSLLGQYYRMEGLPEVAIGYFEKALALNPQHKDDIYYWLGELYEESGNDEKALDCWKKVSDFEKKDLFFIKSANMEAKRGDFEKAKSLYEKAIALSPSSEALFGCGIVCYQMGDWTSAVRRFSQLIEKDPEYVSAYPLLGESLWELGLKEQAIAVYKQGIRMQSDDIHLLDRLAFLLAETDRLREVKDLLQNMKEIDEQDPILCYWQGRIAEEEGFIQEAMVFYQQVHMSGEVIHDTIERLNSLL